MTLRTRLRPSLALTGILAVAALGLAGCASGDAGTGSAPDASGTPAAATSLSDVKAKGELVIGTEGTYSPFSFHEGSGSGALTGYDVEVATADGTLIALFRGAAYETRGEVVAALTREQR